MLRHRRLFQVMHRLALMGAMLMAVAPTVSRWVQSHAGPIATPVHTIQAMCHGNGMAMTDMPAMHHAEHVMPMEMAHGDGMPMPPGHEGMVCDYCVLAAHLLPFVLVLLLLPLLRPTVVGLLPFLVLRRTTSAWPAHAARGPPERLVA